MLDLTHLRLEDVKGVGTIELNLEPNKHAYVFIGKNGIGKTKLLEYLYKKINHESIKSHISYIQTVLNEDNKNIVKPAKSCASSIITAHNRGYFTKDNQKQQDIRDWIIESANLSSVFQRSKNNREQQLKTLLRCLHEIDPSYDSSFLEIDENQNIFLKINDQEKELSELSTGFVSIFKIITQVVSVYSKCNQEIELSTDLRNIYGIWFIDEIESHLHLEWQVKIIPLLKKLFPNTVFFIATHSPLVLSQLEDGEAYELRRDEDEVVRTHKIDNPSKVTIVDLLRQAFGIDLNQLKTEQMSAAQQQEVKKALLELLD